MEGSGRVIIGIYCGAHRKPHWITAFHLRDEGSWEELPAASASRRREQKEWLAEHRPSEVEGVGFYTTGGNPPGGDRATMVWLNGDEVWESPFFRDMPTDELMIGDFRDLDFSAVRSVYPNRCTRCGASVPRRRERMMPLLDLVVATSRTRVSLMELQAIAAEWDGRHGVSRGD